jgi:hypothetical protein
MNKSTTALLFAVCFSALCLYGGVVAHAKGGSPGYHMFRHQGAATFITHPRAYVAAGHKVVAIILDPRL